MNHLALFALSSLLLWFGRVILQQLARHVYSYVWGVLHHHLTLPRRHSQRDRPLHHPRLPYVSYLISLRCRKPMEDILRPQSRLPPSPHPAPRIEEPLQ
jgi:hypothetical protein